MKRKGDFIMRNISILLAAALASGEQLTKAIRTRQARYFRLTPLSVLIIISN